MMWISTFLIVPPYAFFSALTAQLPTRVYQMESSVLTVRFASNMVKIIAYFYQPLRG